MRASRLHYFYAENWPLKLWFVALPLLFVGISVHEGSISHAVLEDWRSLLWLTGYVVVWLLLGLFSALLLGWFVLGPHLFSRGIKNGAPFRSGDLVEILSKPYRGRVARVYSEWQSGSVRVDLGADAKAGFDDIFSTTAILRVLEELGVDDAAELPVAPEPAQPSSVDPGK